MLKLLFSTLLISFTSFANIGYSQNKVDSSLCDHNRTIESYLRKFDFEKYRGKEVYKLLDKIIYKYTDVAFVTMTPFVLSCVKFQYSKNLWVEVYIKEYKYLEKELPEGKRKEDAWSIEDSKKEKIYKIKFIKGTKVLRQTMTDVLAKSNK